MVVTKIVLFLIYLLPVALSAQESNWLMWLFGIGDSDSPKFPTPRINDMTSEEARAATVVPKFPGQTVYSGFVEINPETGSSMYFIYYSALKKSNAPLILWMEGGPGCSSWDSNFDFIGPYGLNYSDEKGIYMEPRTTTWNDEFDVLFIDNPVGTGYSYIGSKDDYISNEDEMVKNFYFVLQTWMKTFPEFQDKEVYVMGHSYGGHYSPPLVTHILEENEHITDDEVTSNVKIDLKALVLGDPLINMANQIQFFGDIAFANGYCDEKQLAQIKQWQNEGRQYALDGKFMDAHKTFWKVLNTLEQEAGINPTNLREFNGGPPNYQSNYLNQADVKGMFHIPSWMTFTDCSSTVAGYLAADEARDYQTLLPKILETMPVLFYTGLDDLLVNHIGNDAIIATTDWPGRQDFLNSERTIWKNNDGDVAGYQRVNENLMQVFMLDAGHIAPRDQKENGRELIGLFHEFVEEW
eukprot:CAMPEP_0114989334 /NCGR_PEP_ID=MMETSP0216-20121206/10138_1 /TAXON_ID=223996 /ORGANISM="Protocruzia adherens, Strain Boccale" /LENGTH=466 /DNA_ID=CAMNT_0002352297 /DNA_START=31 /DNA_END=1428 /DNA_ORIENTATION=+